MNLKSKINSKAFLSICFSFLIATSQTFFKLLFDFFSNISILIKIKQNSNVATILADIYSYIAICVVIARDNNISETNKLQRIYNSKNEICLDSIFKHV